MSDERNEDVAYLTALKKVSGSESGAAVATQPAHDAAESHTEATVSAINDNEHYKGTEKRRSPRYNCDGSVELAEAGCDVHTWATFTDISLHGCYVEAQATYPVGTGLDMQMELNGVRIETKGTVRVNYPYLGMGIAFVDMSEENRDRLKHLLSTVTYTRVIVGPGVTSVAAACTSRDTAEAVKNPRAIMQALTHYFDQSFILTREDFMKIVAKSQDREKT